MVLNDYRLRPDFAFDTPELQILYQLLCQNGEVTSQDLSEQPEGVQHAWYRMLEEDLPEEIADGELEEVEDTRNRELLRKESQQIGNKVKEASSIGGYGKSFIWNVERLIAQKKKNGVGMAKEQKRYYNIGRSNCRIYFAATRKAELQQMMKLMTSWLFHSH